jgi:hypothetical protein
MLNKHGCFVFEGLQSVTGYWPSNMHFTVAAFRSSFIAVTVAVRPYRAIDVHAVLLVIVKALYLGFLSP